MKRTVVLEISLMAVGVLAGSAACSQPTQQTAVPLPTETVSLPAIPVNIDTPATTATPQPIETIAPVLTQTPTLPLATPTSAAPIQSRCPSRAKTFRPDLLKEGVVVLSDNDNLFLTSGSTQAKIALPMMTLKHSIWGISASGDKQRLKYVEEAQDSTGLVVDTWVWLVNSDGKKEKVYHWDKSAGQAFNGLGNRELVVGSMSYTYLSPFTNKWMTVEPSSLPEIQHFTGGILDPFPLVVPNTALSVVAYAGEGGRVLTLWSVSSHKVFAKMPGLDPITIPTWSPDGSQLAFSASSNVNDYAHTDLFSVTVDGHVKQLTHLEGFLPFVNVGDFSWSPNGRFVSFWLDGRPDLYTDNGPRRLMVLDSSTGEIRDTCVTDTESEFLPWPLWSPDSQQMVVYRSGPAFLVDLVQNWAVELPDRFTPIEWLARSSENH